jgi:hypothetical protein
MPYNWLNTISQGDSIILTNRNEQVVITDGNNSSKSP